MDVASPASPAALVSTCTASCCSCRARPALSCSHGRSLLQMHGLSVRVQALAVGGAAGLRPRSSVSPSGIEAGGARPAGGRADIQRPQTRKLLPTHGLLLSLLPGVHERDSADLLPVSEPNQSEFCSCDSGPGRRTQVGKNCMRRVCVCVCRHVFFKVQNVGVGWDTSLTLETLQSVTATSFDFLRLHRLFPHTHSQLQ